jgi:RNA polymerase sigma factor (sigma-70 family)
VPEDRLEHLLRDLAPQVLASVARRFRDFAAAEDAVQEALLAAALQWPKEGVPDSPRGWLAQVAARRMVDHVRSETARRRRESVADESYSFSEGRTDDTLLLLFLCCHPALSAPSAIALTLRAVGGLTTAEIARAFLVPESTMAQRISRAKQTIKACGARFQMRPEERASRLKTVLHILYLIFNEGYASSIGAHLQRVELSAEAIRLAREVYCQLPRDPEVAGLLALMLLTDARRAARTGPEGELIPLDEQNRGLWNRLQITEGISILTSALSLGAVGLYQLQAAIAAVHDEATSVDSTDWPQILALYDLLARMSNNPMVMLNRAIAVSMVHGPNRALAILDQLASDPRLAQHHRLSSVRAHLLEMTGDHSGAVANYRMAAGQTTSLPERNYLIACALRVKLLNHSNRPNTP